MQALNVSRKSVIQNKSFRSAYLLLGTIPILMVFALSLKGNADLDQSLTTTVPLLVIHVWSLLLWYKKKRLAMNIVFSFMLLVIAYALTQDLLKIRMPVGEFNNIAISELAPLDFVIKLLVLILCLLLVTYNRAGIFTLCVSASMAVLAFMETALDLHSFLLSPPDWTKAIGMCLRLSSISVSFVCNYGYRQKGAYNIKDMFAVLRPCIVLLLAVALTSTAMLSLGVAMNESLREFAVALQVSIILVTAIAMMLVFKHVSRVDEFYVLQFQPYRATRSGKISAFVNRRYYTTHPSFRPTGLNIRRSLVASFTK
jgi:hypothetical protein